MRDWLRAHWLSGSTLVVLAAVLVGGALRVVGAWWGLPIGLHPDEWVIVQGAVDLAARNSFEPSLFLRPDHVEIKLSFLAYSLYALLHGTSVEAVYAANGGELLLISRLITATLGTAMIVLAALIGRRFSPAVTAIAAVLFALFPPFVFHSHLATPDIPLALASMGLVLALLYYVARPGWVSLLAGSAMVSVSIAIKYPGAISAILIAIVVIVTALRDRRPWRILSHGAAAIGGVVGFLFLISPVLFTNIAGVNAAIQRESRTEHPGADGLGWGGNLLFYASEFALAAGILVVALMAVGIVLAIRGRLIAALPLTLGFLTWVVLAAVPLHWERWGVPMYISPLLFAALGAWLGYRYVGERWPDWRWRRLLAIVVATLVILNLLLASVAIVARFLAPDTRVQARQDIERLGLTAENTILDGYSPLNPNRPLNIVEDFRWEGETLVPLDDSKEFVLISGCRYERFTADRHPEEFAVYEGIREQFEPVWQLTNIREVPEVQRTGIEPWNIVSSIGELAYVANGGLTGCDLEVYRIT